MKILQIEERKNRLEAIIGEFLIENLSSKEITEICQVGNFLSLLDKDPSIVKYQDRPDFIISYDSQLIGLEHTRIVNEELVEKNRSIKALFDEAAVDFQKAHPDYKILANCWLTDNNLSVKKVDKLFLKKQIVDYIFSLVTNQQSEKPSFIHRISTMKHTLVDFCYNPGAYFVTTLDSDTLEKTIASKDKLVDNYRENYPKLSEQWLLIVISLANKDSYELDEKLIEKGLKSKFDRVYLLDDFKSEFLRAV